MFGPKRRQLLRHWPDRPFVYHGPADRLSRLTSLVGLQSVGQLAAARAAFGQDLRVVGPDGLAAELPARQALHFYHRGDHLSCRQLEDTLPELRGVLAELARDLDEHPQHFYAGMFATAGARGASMHYDDVLTFNVQLRGEKVWRMAPNRHVENPLRAGSTRDDHAPRFARRPLPATMPSDATTFRVKPGSVVFIPRGYWHATEPEGESFAVYFSVRPPTWATRVLHELRRQLESQAAWRAYPTALERGRPRRLTLEEQIGALLPQLRSMVDALAPADVLDSPLSERCFDWPPGVQRTVVTTTRGRYVLRVAGPDRVAETVLDASLLPIVRWLCSHTGAFSIERARASFPELDASYVDALIDDLVAQGVLRKI